MPNFNDANGKSDKMDVEFTNLENDVKIDSDTGNEVFMTIE